MKKFFFNYEKKIINDPQTKKDFLKISNFEKKKYRKYSKILGLRLNLIHNEGYKVKFWQKMMFYFLLIHISQCYRIYKSSNQIKKIKNLKYVKFKKFYIPDTQSEHREFFQRSYLGQEKIFSTLVEYLKIKYSVQKIYKNNILKKTKTTKVKYKFKFNFVFLRIFNFFLKIIKKPSVLVSKCYWSEESRQRIKFDFLGKIKIHNFYLPTIKDTSISIESRRYLSETSKKFDNFDKFFFKTLSYSFPKSFLENFKLRKKYTLNFINQKKLEKIKYILNESLDEDNLLLNALSSEKNIKNIYTEHNFLHHPFVGSHLDLILENFDKYITSGWLIKNNKKIIKGGSHSHVFKFPSTKKNKKQQILFVSGILECRAPFATSMYGEFGFKASKTTVENMNIFFSNLNNYNKNKIMIKQHPLSLDKNYSNYNFMDKKVFNNKNLIKGKKKFIHFLQNTKLVILPYYSTPFLQSILFNVPTVVFLNQNSYFLKKEYNTYFDDFYKTGILQKNAVSASKFVNKISQDPYKWWYKHDVQKARNKFLKENINNVDFEMTLSKLIKN